MHTPCAKQNVQTFHPISPPAWNHGVPHPLLYQNKTKKSKSKNRYKKKQILATETLAKLITVHSSYGIIIFSSTFLWCCFIHSHLEDYQSKQSNFGICHWEGRSQQRRTSITLNYSKTQRKCIIKIKKIPRKLSTVSCTWMKTCGCFIKSKETLCCQSVRCRRDCSC